MSEENAQSSDVENLSHKVVLQRAKELLSSLLDDPFLSGVSVDDSVKDVDGRLALAQGKAISIHIKKYDGEIISVIVMQGCLVKDVMDAFQREVEKLCARRGTTSYISWRYVWQTYCLVHGQTLLTDAKAKLFSYGIVHQSTLHFIKKLKAKNRER